MTLTEKVTVLETNLARLQEDKARLERLQSQLDEMCVERDKADLDVKHYKEENERLRAHYEVLKEHELNLIKDYEGKIEREHVRQEQRLQEIQEEIRQT